MASILENVRRGLETAPARPQLGAQEQTQQLTRATTGKAVGSGTTPGLSTQQQQAAAQQTMQQQRQVQLKQQEVSGALAAGEKQIQQEQRQAKREFTQREVQVKEQAYQKLGMLLDDMAKKSDQLGLAKNKAQVEQAGFLLRLNNEKYITRLEVEGRKSRLNDEIRFKEALTQSIFAEERELFKSSLQFQSLVRAEGREFKEELAMLDLDQAMEIAQMNADNANEKAKWEAIGGIITGAVSIGASAYGMKMPTKSPTPGTGVPLESAANPYGPEAPIMSQIDALQDDLGLESTPAYSGPWRP